MARIDLHDVWLHRADTHATFLVVRIPPGGLKVGAGRPVEWRARAGGRVVQVVRPSRQRTVDITGHTVSRQDLDTLQTWMGDLLMLRAPSGEVLHGTFADVAAQMRPDGLHDVSLTFSTVTVDLAV